jgi:cell filamentation protein
VPHDPYVYPGTDVLRNSRDVRDPQRLDVVEAEITTVALARISKTPLPGSYDLDHLRAFHRRIFGGIYPWAGEIRTVQITKGGDLFAMPQHIESYLSVVLTKLPDENYLRDMDHAEFVERLADYYAEINAAHPFREGNGRTQRAFLSQLANDAGYRVRWDDLDPERNNEASRAANRGDPGPMRDLLADITLSRARSLQRSDELAAEEREREDDPSREWDDDRER